MDWNKGMMRFEYKIFGRLAKAIEAECSVDKVSTKLSAGAKKILLNLQVSGGMDSMCLLHVVTHALNSNLFPHKNKFIIVVQHFNHKKRGEESDADADFVTNTCLKIGIPVFQSDFLTYQNIEQDNFQNTARQWRKTEALSLSEKLKNELNCEKYFIVTAHHARDHVETIMQHILRGCSLQGLTGIQEFDEQQIYFRPFFDVEYEKLVDYAYKKKITFRTDSSNLADHYERNYIRNHIIPHFKKLRPQYEKSFRKLSDHACESMMFLTKAHKVDLPLKLTPNSQPNEIINILKKKEKALGNILTRNSLYNILHEAHLLRISNKPFKEIRLSLGWLVRLSNDNNFDIGVEVFKKES